MENKDFIPYQEAFELKELGFDKPCFRWYDERWGDDLQQDKFNTNKDLFMTDLDCSAPLYQQAFRWFREKHKLFSTILPFQDIEDDIRLCYYYCIINLDECKDEDILCNESSLGASDINFSSPEVAELACLKELIEIVKNK
jgi:hypothetical protein